MTEINHVLTFPIKKYEHSYDDRIETMERKQTKEFRKLNQEI